MRARAADPAASRDSCPRRLPAGSSSTAASTHDETVGHYRDADVFCSPALGHESFGVILLEAMATGTAIIASDIDGYRDLVTDNREGILVPPGDARALAGGLRRLIGDAALRERSAPRACARRSSTAGTWSPPR